MKLNSIYSINVCISLEEFRTKFFYFFEDDLLYKNLKEGKIKLEGTESNTAYVTKKQTSKEDNNDNGGELIPRI